MGAKVGATEVSFQGDVTPAPPPLCQAGAGRVLPALGLAGAPPSGPASAWARLGAAGNMGLWPEMTAASAHGAGPSSWGSVREKHSGQGVEEPVGGGTGWMRRNWGEEGFGQAGRQEL